MTGLKEARGKMLTCKYSKQNSDNGRGKGSEEQVETHWLVK